MKSRSPPRGGDDPPAVTAIATWTDLGVPYRLARTVTIEGNDTLVDVAPGARFEAASGAAISVQEGAVGGQAATLTFVDNVVRQSAGSGIRLEHPDTTVTPVAGELPAQNDFQSATIAGEDVRDVR